MSELARVFGALSTARTYAEMLTALGGAFGAGPEQLFIVDHDRTQIRFLDGARSATIAEEFGRALRMPGPYNGGDGWWLPIPEGDAAVLGLFRPEEPEGDEAADLERTAGHVGLCSAALRARFEDVDRHRRRRGMSVAAELQWDLLPTRADSIGGFSFASVLEPAYEVAGDLFDYAWVDDALWVYSLDAMGHGMEATLSGVVALTAIRNGRRDGAGIVEQISQANDAVHRQWHGDRFVTAVACRLDDDGIDIVNAGHEPLRRRHGEHVERLQVPTSIPLGIDEATSYQRHTVPALSVDESLILLSDGSSEARDHDGVAFGAPAVDTALSSMGDLTPQQMAHEYIQAIVEFAGDQPIGDDITIVVVSTDAAARR